MKKILYAGVMICGVLSASELNSLLEKEAGLCQMVIQDFSKIKKGDDTAREKAIKEAEEMESEAGKLMGYASRDSLFENYVLGVKEGAKFLSRNASRNFDERTFRDAQAVCGYISYVRDTFSEKEGRTLTASR